MSAPASAIEFNGSVTVKLPFELDVSGLTAELFGEKVDLVGDPIYVVNATSASNFYNPVTGASIIHYVQDISENTFTAVLNLAMTNNAKAAMISTVRTREGEEYDLSKLGWSGLDCTQLSYGWSAPYRHFYSIEDFVLSYIAHKIFGHPGALAPIQNDSTIRVTISQQYIAGIKKLDGKKGAAVDDATKPAYQDMSGVLAGIAADIASTRTEQPGAMSAADVNQVVQQFMNQSPGRFTYGDKGVLNPLRFNAGDKIEIRMNLSGTKYKLYTGGTNAAGVTDHNSMIPSGGPSTIDINDNSVFRLIFNLN